MSRAVAQGGVAPEIEVGVEVVSELKEGLFDAGKRAAVREQFRFQGAPVGLGLVVIIEVARPAKARE